MDTCILEFGVRTLRLLRSRAAERGPVEVADVDSERVRLDESIDRTGAVTASVSSELLAAASRLIDVSRAHCGDASLYAIAPHALGGARNARSVLGAVQRRTGVAVALLSPKDTARLAYRGARSELGYLGGQTAVVHLGDASTDFTSGTRATLEVCDTLPLGIGRLHLACGAGDCGLAAADAGALAALVRLCAGPATRRLRERGVSVLVVTSENAAAVREVGRAWGFLGEESETIGRVALRALTAEILGASVWDLENLGVDPRRAALVGTTAVTIDAVADLLGQRDVLLGASGPSEGVALEVLGRPALKLASGA